MSCILERFKKRRKNQSSICVSSSPQQSGYLQHGSYELIAMASKVQDKNQGNLASLVKAMSTDICKQNNKLRIAAFRQDFLAIMSVPRVRTLEEGEEHVKEVTKEEQ